MKRRMGNRSRRRRERRKLSGERRKETVGWDGELGRRRKERNREKRREETEKCRKATEI